MAPIFLSSNLVSKSRIETITGIKGFINNIILSKSQGKGLLIDPDSPSYSWKDLIGEFLPDLSGAGSPLLTEFRGGQVRYYSYNVNDRFDVKFHIPHDWAVGTDMFLHIHWSHNGTAISGSLGIDFYWTYAKGHNQAIFTVEKTLSISYDTVNIATTPRWVHRIDEIQFSTPGGSATLLDTALIEPDGIVGINMTVTGIPTITGGSPDRPFVFFCDLHYQCCHIGTKQKAPDFYE